MASQALQSFKHTVNVAWPKGTEARARAHLIKVATAGHEQTMREQESRAGQRPDFDMYVNRPGNSDLQSVVLPGPIVYLYRYAREVMIEAIGHLRRASPVQSGAYRDNHTLYVDGVETQDFPDTIDRSHRIMIANPIPYARRIEVGRTKAGRSFVLKVPNRIYERVVKQGLLPVYGNDVKITFGYVDLPDAHVIKGRLPGFYGSRSGTRRRRQRVGGKVPAPAIFIEMK